MLDISGWDKNRSWLVLSVEKQKKKPTSCCEEGVRSLPYSILGITPLYQDVRVFGVFVNIEYFRVVRAIVKCVVRDVDVHFLF